VAIDSAEKRKSIRGIGRQWGGPGVTPNASPDAEWRLETARHYSGIAAFTPDPQFSNVRVEANSFGSATLRWSYSGGSEIQIYRSTDGSTWTFVATVSSSTTSYIASDLEPKTLYYFRLTDDFSVTFSSSVTVTTHASTRRLINQTPQRVNRLVTHVDPKDFNELASQVESRVHNAADSTEPCVVCPQNGAVVIDCSTQCKYFKIIATEDINSISIIGCDAYTCPTVEFVIPPNTTRSICGWPVGCEFLGEECTEAPIDGGTTGTTVFSSGISFPGTGSPLSPGTSPCPCETTTGLNIQCCEEGTGACTLDCSTNPIITFKACGGVAPYKWTKSGGINIQPQGAFVKASVTGKKSTYTGSSSDIAFVRLGYATSDCPTSSACAAGGLLGDGNAGVARIAECYNCDMTMKSQAQTCADVLVPGYSAGFSRTLSVVKCSTGVRHGPFAVGTANEITGFTQSGTVNFTADYSGDGGFSAGGTVPVTPIVGSECTSKRVLHAVVDVRTQAMKNAGCNMTCGAAIVGATITVTDGTGVSVTKVIA
jgi:hypothetical protein